jgi:hypothetical protein
VTSTLAIAQLNAHILVAGSINHGIGRRTHYESRDILLQDAPQDLFEELTCIISGDGRKLNSESITEVTALLHVDKHPNCYRPPERSSPATEEADEGLTELDGDDDDEDEANATGSVRDSIVPDEPVQAVATRSTRRFPVIAVLITLILLLGGLAAAATVWGPGVGFTALSDLLDPR